MSHRVRQLRVPWPLRISFRGQGYQEIPQPSLSANCDGGGYEKRNTPMGPSEAQEWHKRNSIIPFLLGCAFASAIAGALLLMIIIDVRTRLREPDHTGVRSTHFTFTPNWAGVVLSTPPKDQRFSAAKANLTIPHFTAAKDTNSWTEEHAVSLWIGLDISAENFTGVRTGLRIAARPDGETVIKAVHQWGPDGPDAYAQLGPIHSGDTVQLEVVMFNTTFAKAEINNFATGERATKYWWKPPYSDATLSGQDIQWILEDVGPSAMDGVKSPFFLDFGRIILEHCIVWTDKDELLTADQGDMYRIQQAGVARTGVHVEEEAIFFTFIE